MGSGSCLGAGDAFCFFSSLFLSVQVNYMTCTDVFVPAPNWSAQSRKEWRWVTDPAQTQEQKRGRQVRERKRSADTKTTNWKGEKMSDNSCYLNAAFLNFCFAYFILCFIVCFSMLFNCKKVYKNDTIRDWIFFVKLTGQRETSESICFFG